MKILEITDRNRWEDFLAGVEKKTFLQSWAWGEFQKAMGEKIWRAGVYEQRESVGVCLVIKVEAKRGSFLFVPHGPVFKCQMSNVKCQNYLKKISVFLKNLAKEEDCSFIRISPILEDTEENRELFVKLGFREAPMHMHAELTWVLDISKSEEEILQEMRKTTRNLVRRGEREGVEVFRGDLDEFYPLFEETAKRQGFVRFSREYLQKEFDAFRSSAEVFLAMYQGEILAGAFIVFYDDTAYYHHAASVHSKVPAAYSLIWEIIKEAKKRGMKWYNFWGVVKEDDTKHPWWGLSLFKRGFGGREWALMHAQDLALSWRYWISWGIEKARKWKRRY